MSFAILLKLLATMKETIIAVLISIIGWLAHYVHDLLKEWSTETFSILRMLANAFLAWFVWYIIYGFIPHDSNLVGVIVGIGWFSATKILPLLEQIGVKIVEKYLNNKL